MPIKFIGGPLDGEYRDIDIRRDHVWAVRESKPLPCLRVECMRDEEGNLILDAFDQPIPLAPKFKAEHTKYTLRHFAGEAGNVYWFAPEEWSDIYTLSQIVHHYPERS